LLPLLGPFDKLIHLHLLLIQLLQRTPSFALHLIENGKKSDVHLPCSTDTKWHRTAFGDNPPILRTSDGQHARTVLIKGMCPDDLLDELRYSLHGIEPEEQLYVCESISRLRPIIDWVSAPVPLVCRFEVKEGIGPEKGFSQGAQHVMSTCLDAISKIASTDLEA
jgi:hypothetical protein